MWRWSLLVAALFAINLPYQALFVALQLMGPIIKLKRADIVDIASSQLLIHIVLALLSPRISSGHRSHDCLPRHAYRWFYRSSNAYFEYAKLLSKYRNIRYLTVTLQPSPQFSNHSRSQTPNRTAVTAGMVGDQPQPSSGAVRSLTSSEAWLKQI
jgi:hypothetical protein